MKTLFSLFVILSLLASPLMAATCVGSSGLFIQPTTCAKSQVVKLKDVTGYTGATKAITIGFIIKAVGYCGSDAVGTTRTIFALGDPTKAANAQRYLYVQDKMVGGSRQIAIFTETGAAVKALQTSNFVAGENIFVQMSLDMTTRKTSVFIWSNSESYQAEVPNNNNAAYSGMTMNADTMLYFGCDIAGTDRMQYKFSDFRVNFRYIGLQTLTSFVPDEIVSLKGFYIAGDQSLASTNTAGALGSAAYYEGSNVATAQWDNSNNYLKFLNVNQFLYVDPGTTYRGGYTTQMISIGTIEFTVNLDSLPSAGQTNYLIKFGDEDHTWQALLVNSAGQVKYEYGTAKTQVATTGTIAAGVESTFVLSNRYNPDGLAKLILNVDNTDVYKDATGLTVSTTAVPTGLSYVRIGGFIGYVQGVDVDIGRFTHNSGCDTTLLDDGTNANSQNGNINGNASLSGLTEEEKKRNIILIAVLVTVGGLAILGGLGYFLYKKNLNKKKRRANKYKEVQARTDFASEGSPNQYDMDSSPRRLVDGASPRSFRMR